MYIYITCIILSYYTITPQVRANEPPSLVPRGRRPGFPTLYYYYYYYYFYYYYYY